MDLHVQPNFVTITTFFASFDLWMSRGGANIFALVINYLDKNYIQRHDIVRLVEAQETKGSAIGFATPRFAIKNWINPLHSCFCERQG
jgi:hypothetical protein